MKHIEIPYQEERGRRYRFFEMLPGLLTWSILTIPFILGYFYPTIAIVFVIGYLLLWFLKTIGLNIRSIQGYRQITLQMKLPWRQMIDELESGKITQPEKFTPTWHYENVAHRVAQHSPITPSNIVHAIVIAAYNETREILEPTIQSVIDSDYDMKKVILVLAYEERGGPQVDATAQDLVKVYGSQFKHAMAVKHPDGMAGEVRGKGGNITYAAQELEQYVKKQKLDPLDVIVTTLDSDNRPHKEYLAALTYLYSITPDPRYVSYQPIPMYTNNIWDAPAPMRVIATGNSFWNIVLSMRPHMIRNFSSHAQSLASLIDTDYWSVRTIVEDGHQFWRTYFRYDGRHEVYPLYVPIYQDAVLSDTYRKTLWAQFVQLRRWAWGASDVAYVAEKGFFSPNKVPRFDLIAKFLRLLEGHVTWAVAPLLLAFSAFIPALFYPDTYATTQLPIVASWIQRIALIGIFLTLFLSLKLLPPKPARYKRHRSFFMVIQWGMLPVTTVVYNSFAALYSQTRLMFGKYLDSFEVTDKAVVTDTKERIM